MKRVVYISGSIVVSVVLIALFVYLTEGKHIPVLQPTGEVAEAQRNLFIFTASLSALVVLPVFALLAYISITFREGNTKAAYRPDWSGNTLLEAIWWGIPILIIGVLAVVTYQTSHSLDPYKELEGGKPVEVQVVALRWKWLFIYPEHHVATLNQAYIPNERPVRFTMTANAPMSAFWIPSLGSQIYAMNGMHSQLNLKGKQAGTYTGYTTNINGEGYAKMTFEMNVVDQAKFNAWVDEARQSPDTMDLSVYERLSQPKSITDKQTYRLADDQLFAIISSTFSHSHSSNGGH
ncbi:MAG: hypothetical protein WBK76_03900 [Candidatus Saccharimonadales bacterium]